MTPIIAQNNFLWRKILHMTVGAFSVWVIWYIPYPQIIVVAFLLMLIVLMMEYWRMTDNRWRNLARALLSPVIRQREGHTIVGAAWFLVGAFLTVMLPSMTAAITAILVWGFADPFGEIIGRTVRGPRLHRMTQKHWSGTIAVFIVACIVAGMWLTAQDIAHAWSAAVVIGLGASGAEALSDVLGIDDNLSIPVVTGLITFVFLSL